VTKRPPQNRQTRPTLGMCPRTNAAPCACLNGTSPQPPPAAMSSVGAALLSGIRKSLSARYVALPSQPLASSGFAMLIFDAVLRPSSRGGRDGEGGGGREREGEGGMPIYTSRVQRVTMGIYYMASNLRTTQPFTIHAESLCSRNLCLCK
jgi:hypothetical protein